MSDRWNRSGVWTFGGGWFGRLGHNDMDAGCGGGLVVSNFRKRNGRKEMYPSWLLHAPPEAVSIYVWYLDPDKHRGFPATVDGGCCFFICSGEPIRTQDHQQPDHQDPHCALRSLPHLCFGCGMELRTWRKFPLAAEAVTPGNLA